MYLARLLKKQVPVGTLFGARGTNSCNFEMALVHRAPPEISRETGPPPEMLKGGDRSHNHSLSPLQFPLPTPFSLKTIFTVVSIIL